MVKPISWFGHETDMEPILHAPLLFMNCPHLHFHLNPFLPGSLTDFCDNTHTNFSYLKVRFHLHSHHKLLAILGRIAQLPSLMNNHIHKSGLICKMKLSALRRCIYILTVQVNTW